jgi:hypothetical protein
MWLFSLVATAFSLLLQHRDWCVLPPLLARRCRLRWQQMPARLAVVAGDGVVAAVAVALMPLS